MLKPVSAITKGLNGDNGIGTVKIPTVFDVLQSVGGGFKFLFNQKLIYPLIGHTFIITLLI